ncbi:MAG: cyclic nucleotide-binding domain-containing protein [bacterium]
MAYRESFLKRGEERKYFGGEVIYSEGQLEEVPLVYYITMGSVSLTKNLGGRGDYTVVLGVGNFFGIEEVFAGVPRNVTATAKGDTTLYCWERDMFEIMVGIDQEFATEVITHLSQRLRCLNEQIKALSSPPSVSPHRSLFNLAEYYFFSGRYKHALDAYIAYLNRYPGGDCSDMARERIEEIRSQHADEL